MFFAYDATITGSRAAETVGSRRERKVREREGSISSQSSSERPSSSRSAVSAFSFGFGFGGKLSKKNLRPKTATSSRSAEDLQPRSGRASPLPITPPEPSAAQVVHEVAHSNASVGSFRSLRKYDISVTRSFEKLNVRSPSKAVSLESQDSTLPRSPRAPTDWSDPHYEGELYEHSLPYPFPLTPDSTAPSSPWTDRRKPVPQQRLKNPSTDISEDQSRRGGPPTMLDVKHTNTQCPLLGQRSALPLTLTRMESAGLKIMLKRLSEDWTGGHGDVESLEEALFEQKLWALMARQWLTQGKQLQCPAHDALVASKPPDGKRILNLYGSLADGWVLAAKYPSSWVFTLTTSRDDLAVQNYSWSPPQNHSSSYIPTTDDFFPFPDNYFDVITSRCFSSVVKSRSWLSVLQESHRCLKPGGWLEIQSLDALPNRQGELLKSWVETWLLDGIEDFGLVVKPSLRLIDYLDLAGFGDIKTCKIALPVVVKAGTEQEQMDTVNVMVQAGRHYYQELYYEFLRQPSGKMSSWWWDNKEVRQECEREDTLFGFMISFGQKE